MWILGRDVLTRVHRDRDARMYMCPTLSKNVTWCDSSDSEARIFFPTSPVMILAALCWMISVDRP